MEDVADKYQLRQYITTGRKIVGAFWHEDRQKWEVHSKKTDGRRTVISSMGITEGETGDVTIDECDVFINASGYFNQWRWPSTPGREKFKGITVHSADYDNTVDLKGKRVALIGNGSSGIQIAAAIQKVAGKMSVYMRSPTWITASVASSMVPSADSLQFTEEQKTYWSTHPKEYLEYRKILENELNDAFPYFIKETKHQTAALAYTIDLMKERLASKPELAKLLLPSYSVGCRRPTPGTGFLESLCADNANVVWGELDSFTEKGIKSPDGTEREFDVIICATGFDMSM
jgi:cation diffusion facilitator CzcD-associated flavoprotein CzcO